MSDNHPNIPPKSKAFFLCDRNETWCFDCPDELSDICYGIYLDEATKYERFIIACVAECEWRKRAERADKICKFYFEVRRKGVGFGLYPNDFEQWSDRAKWERAHNELQKANEAIDAWRAWGSGGIWDAALAQGKANNGNS